LIEKGHLREIFVIFERKNITALKLLIVRFSSIGDIVLTSPVPRIAKEQLKAEVHYVTKSQYVSLLENSPHIDKIYSFEKNINEVIPLLKKEKYDYIIDLHNSLRSKILKYKLKIKSKVVDKKNPDKWKMVNLKSKITIPHIVNRYIAPLERLGCHNDEKGLDFFYKKDKMLFEKYNIPTPYICISLGAKHFTKKIPINVIIDIISGINKNIVLIGGNDVIDEALEIEKNIDKPLVNLVGKINIPQSAQIIDYCEKLLTADTGMMHIAAALKKETIVLWGNTVPEFGMYPYYGKHKVKSSNFEVSGLKCRPCSKIGFDKCPKGHFKCMTEQNTEEIISSLY